jgi:hypothetical protein
LVIRHRLFVSNPWYRRIVTLNFEARFRRGEHKLIWDCEDDVRCCMVEDTPTSLAYLRNQLLLDEVPVGEKATLYPVGA